MRKKTVPPSAGLRAQTMGYIAQQDSALNKRAGWEQNSLGNLVETLITHGRVEVGWRESCGTTDFTMQIHRAWRKVLPKLKKDGLSINETPVKHKNAYATSHGGFWSSIIYEYAEGPAKQKIGETNE